MKKYNNKEYNLLVEDIMNDNDFLKLENINHHGTNRLDHSIRVSYHSYKIAKKLKLNYKDTARYGLLHDYFFEENYKMKRKVKRDNLFNHPKWALKNVKEKYDVTELGEDIILGHMFPIGLRMPRHRESWIVNITDDIVSIYEKINSILKTIT